MINKATTESVVKFRYEQHGDYLENKKINKDLIAKLLEKLTSKDKKNSYIIYLTKMNLITN
jgi:hypothetical protein